MKLENILKQAMELEKTQGILYKGLEKKFSFSGEIAQFWAEMAEDEKDHYERIAEMYNKFSAEQLSVEADNSLYNAACKGLRELKLSRLDDIYDLSDACEFAAEIENYETVALFEFVNERFKHDLHRAEVSSAISVHLEKLASFSNRFGSADDKRLIKALKNV